MQVTSDASLQNPFPVYPVSALRDIAPDILEKTVFTEAVSTLDGAIRGPGLERMLARHALTLVVSHAPNRRYRRMLIVPNGFDETPAAAATDSGNVTFFFPANFRYEPNLDGGEWFIESILPILRRTVDDPVVAFAGQCREGFQAYGAKNGVRVVGRIKFRFR